MTGHALGPSLGSDSGSEDDRGAYCAIGGFDEWSAISDLHFKHRFPAFRCSQCGNEGMAYHLGYPHLDPSTVLSPAELKLIDARKPTGASNHSGTLSELANRLEDQWGIPVTSGAHFGPLRIKVSATPRFDFDVMTVSRDFFMRRSAAELLRKQGFDFDFVTADAYGKRAAEADFVQCIVPVVAHCELPHGTEFCSHCKRKSHPTSSQNPPVLCDSPRLRGLPFFFALEVAVLYTSVGFVEAANRIGLRGLIEGKTVQAMPSTRGTEAERRLP